MVPNIQKSLVFASAAIVLWLSLLTCIRDPTKYQNQEAEESKR